MSTTLPNPLPRRYYLGWVDGENNWGDGIAVARTLASRLGLPLTFVVPTKNHLDERLKRENVITTRVARPPHGTFVAALHPDLRDMARSYAEDRPFLVIDFARNEMHGWAATQNAYNLGEAEVMADDRPDAIREIHEHIESIGYNGYRSPPGSYTIERDLRELHSAGWLDERGKSYLLGCLYASRTDSSLEDLRRLADKINPRPLGFAHG